MKWRHSKEAQAQKDKEKEQSDKPLTEGEQKEQESECESEASECDLDEAPDRSDVDIAEHNKRSVIMNGAPPASAEEAAPLSAATETSAS